MGGGNEATAPTSKDLGRTRRSVRHRLNKGNSKTNDSTEQERETPTAAERLHNGNSNASQGDSSQKQASRSKEAGQKPTACERLHKGNRTVKADESGSKQAEPTPSQSQQGTTPETQAPDSARYLVSRLLRGADKECQ